MSSPDHSQELARDEQPKRDDRAARDEDPARVRVTSNAFAERPFSLEARLGIATPTGALGIAAEYSFVPWFALGCGVGTNVLGAEPACWLTLRAIGGRHRNRALTFSSGASSAPFIQSKTTQNGVFGVFTGPLSAMGHSAEPDERRYDRAYWLNMDIGYERRGGTSVFRVFAGGAGLLNPSDGVERRSGRSDEVRADSPVQVLAYLGLGWGFSL